VDRDNEIGIKMKELRTERNMTLKELADLAKVSVSYLSMLERGNCSISLSSLKSLAKALGVNGNVFFSVPQANNKDIVRSYESTPFLVSTYLIHDSLIGDIPIENRVMDPLFLIALPGQGKEDFCPYPHEGEEFVYVLEGTLTCVVNDQWYDLGPGDCLHIKSQIPHAWGNLTSKLVKALSVTLTNVEMSKTSAEK